MADFKIPNVAYRATVYRTGSKTHFFKVQIFLGQLWKLKDTELINKANEWKSGSEWVFKPSGTNGRYGWLFSSNQQAMGSTNEGLFEVQDFNGNTEQLWEKEVVKDGYFTLTNVKYKTLLTADGTDLILRGNLQCCLQL